MRSRDSDARRRVMRTQQIEQWRFLDLQFGEVAFGGQLHVI